MSKTYKLRRTEVVTDVLYYEIEITEEQKVILENEDEGEEYDELLDELNDEGFDLVGERVGDPDVTYEIIEE
jgi:dissimilatory sulfite reductase (desulfoviridin) alpha/beta subunit